MFTFFRFFSHIGHYSVFSRISCAIQQVISYVLYIQQCVCINPSFPMYPSPPYPLVAIRLFSTSMTRLLFNFKIYLFMAALGVCCCTWAFSSCSVLLIAVASLIAEHRLQGFSSCDAWVQLPHGMWNLPGPGIKPMSHALAGRFLTSGPPGKSSNFFGYIFLFTNSFFTVWNIKILIS